MFDAGCRVDAARPREYAAGFIAPTQSAVALRDGTRADAARLDALERRAFSYDRIARRSFVRFVNSPNASLIVADCDGALSGYALILFRARSGFARLYSIAVDAEHTGRQLGSMLLKAAEDAARRRGANAVRLEVCAANAAAKSLYRKSGYALVDRLPAYYCDGRDALRLQKRLAG
jgi:ribosomal protein S18 acetylase RimI-like enzyme